jgi:hypothetical protein
MSYGRYILLCILFLLFAVRPLFAQVGYSQFERDLQLSETQKARVEETKRRYMHELQGLNQDYVNKRLELREIERSPYPDEERRQRLRTELRSIESSRHSLYNQYRSDVSRSLNEDQRTRYNSFVDTERRRTVTRPSNPPLDRHGAPPMTRVAPPAIDSRPPASFSGRASSPGVQQPHSLTAPSPSQPVHSFSPRTSTPPPPRGYGR